MKDKNNLSSELFLGKDKINNEITDIEGFFELVTKLNLPAKSKYETIKEYQAKIDSILNLPLYKQLLNDTFSIKIPLVKSSIKTDYNAENKTFYLRDVNLLKVYDKHIDTNMYLSKDDNQSSYTTNYYYYLKNRNEYFGVENRLKNGYYSFICESNIAKEENNFDIKVYFTLSNLEIQKKNSNYFNSTDIDSNYYININLHYIELIFKDKILYKITCSSPTNTIDQLYSNPPPALFYDDIDLINEVEPKQSNKQSNREEETYNPHAILQKGKVENTGSEEDIDKRDGKGDGNNGGRGTGSDGTGSGHTFSLAGRGSKSLGLPPSKTDEVGSIVVTIWVNQQGEVVRAVSGARGTTIDNRSLWRHCETAARNSKFSASPQAPEEQKGTIIYKFRR